MTLRLTQMFALSRPCCDLCVSRYISLEILFERGRHLGHRLGLDRSITSWNISANSGMPGAVPIDVKVIALARRRRSSMRPSRKSLTPRSGNRPYGPPVAHDSGLGSWRIGLPCTDQVRTGALTPLPHQIFPLTAARTAFEHMSQSRHVRKVIIAVRPEADRHDEPGDLRDGSSSAEGVVLFRKALELGQPHLIVGRFAT